MRRHKKIRRHASPVATLFPVLVPHVSRQHGGLLLHGREGQRQGMQRFFEKSPRAKQGGELSPNDVACNYPPFPNATANSLK